jgi:uncharacterized membrane protein (DUF485 family)
MPARMNDQRRGNLKLLDDPEFKDLVARKNRFTIQLTILTLIVYYGFIFLVAFKKSVFGIKITTNITLGITIGIGVILASWILTGIYVRWANTRYDVLVQNVKNKLEKHDAGSV